MKPKKKFPWLAVIIPLGIIVVFLGLLAVLLLPFRGVYEKGREFALSARALGSAVKSQDIGASKAALADTHQKLDVLNTEYQKVLYMKAIPFLGAYVADGEHAIKASIAGLSAGDKAIEAIEPNADLLGLNKGAKTNTSFLAGSAEDRLQYAVKTMSALTPKINEMADNVDTVRKEIAQIDPNRYPEKIRGTEIRSRLIGAKAVIEDTANLFVNAQPLLKNLPKLMGEPTEQRYLVLFQNDKELRPTGGFLTAYAQFRFVHGKPILEKADDIYALDAALKTKYPATREINTFHKGVYNLFIRDSNLSPDFRESMQQFEAMYNNTSGKEHIDGIIAVDTHVLVEALKILGPIRASGRTFTAETDKRCDCPQAVYELEDYSSRPVNYVREQRKDEIGVLLQEILRMALGVSPSKYWGSLFQMLIAEINQKHVLAYVHDPASQKAIESFNMAGRIMTASETASLLKYKENEGWDYLHINNSNMAGAKSNMFVSDKVTKDTTVNADGTVTTKLTIDYKNPFPGSDCGLESGGLCLNAPLRDWIRIYVPKGSKLKEAKGSLSPKDNRPADMTTYDSLGKTVFEGFIIINPQGTARLEVTYVSPVKVQGQYNLLIQKQPGTNGSEYLLRLDGKDRKKFILETDTEVSL